MLRYMPSPRARGPYSHTGCQAKTWFYCFAGPVDNLNSIDYFYEMLTPNQKDILNIKFEYIQTYNSRHGIYYLP